MLALRELGVEAQRASRRRRARRASSGADAAPAAPRREAAARRSATASSPSTRASCSRRGASSSTASATSPTARVRRLPSLRAGGLDLIHAHQALPDGALAQRLAADLGVPYVVTVHGADVYQHFRMGGAVERRAKARARRRRRRDGELERRRRACWTASWRRTSCTVVLNGTTGLGAPVEPADDYLPGEPLVLTVGHLIERKGIRDLIAAARAAAPRGPHASTSRSPATGRCGGALEAQAAAEGVADAVHFLGRVPHARVLALMARAQLFALPSWDEAFGLVYTEAMAQGTPVLAGKGEGPEDFIDDGVSGYLVPGSRRRTRWPSIIAEVLDDPAKAAAIGEAGRAAALELELGAQRAAHARRVRAGPRRGTLKGRRRCASTRFSSRPPDAIRRSCFQVSWANGLDIIRDLSAEGVPAARPGRQRARPGPALAARRRHGLPRPARRTRRPSSRSSRTSAGACRSKGVLFPTHDQYIWPISRHAERLEPWYLIPFSRWETMQRLHDKRAQMEAAWRVRRRHAEDGLRRLRRRPRARRRRDRLPVHLQAGRVAGLQDALPPARARDRLRRRAARGLRQGGRLRHADAAGHRPRRRRGALHARLVPGRAEPAAGAVHRPQAAPAPAAVRPRAAWRSASWVPELAEAGLRLLHELGYHGVSQVEFKRDPRDGALPPHGGQRAPLDVALAGHRLRRQPLARRLPRRHRRPVHVAPRQVDGLKWVVSLTDARDAFARWRKGDEKLCPWLKSYRGVRVDGLYSLRDPFPGALLTARQLKNIVTRGGRPAEGESP